MSYRYQNLPLEENKMKKMIKVSANETKAMTFEECLKRFEPMMVKEAKKHTDMVLFNGVEFEDLMQVLSVALWEAYNEYKIELGNQFSTFLYNKLRNAKKEETSPCFAKKRTAEHGIFSIDDALKSEDGSEADTGIYDLKANTERDVVNKEFLDLLKEQLDEMEMDVLRILLDENQGYRANKKAFANKYGFSRPTAYTRIKKITIKIQELMLDNGYML